MEQIVGGELSGSVMGTVVDDVKLVPGKQRKALYVNGLNQKVNLGNQRHNCMGDLSKCTNGFVMAMWLQMHKYDDPGQYTDEYYISNGGQTKNAIGVALLMRERKMLTMFRTESRYWKNYYDQEFSLNTWYHVVLVWNTTFGSKVYVNGALRSHNLDGVSMDSNPNGNGHLDFMLGDYNGSGDGYPGEMTLDELRIWDVVIDDQEVWTLYVADVMAWDSGIPSALARHAAVTLETNTWVFYIIIKMLALVTPQNGYMHIFFKYHRQITDISRTKSLILNASRLVGVKSRMKL